ncbi:maltose ABC transporter permease MalF [Succinimonas sp.]|uniref:maltose ABC transporter permease MalF n=2 Tax=Succinimonas sp. TaxID=1936151 RepID=UPI00386C3DB7
MESIKNGGKASGGGAAKGESGALRKILIMLPILLFGLWWVGSMLSDGQYAFAGLFAVVIGGGLAAFWFNRFYPHRYIFPGIASMIVFIIFPLVYTIYISFTNYSDNNLFTLERAEEFHLQKKYRVEGGEYKFSIVESSNKGLYSIVLTTGGQTAPDGSVTPVETYKSSDIRFYDKDDMAKETTRLSVEKNTIHVEKVDSNYQPTPCGIKCTMKFRDFLKTVKVSLDSNELSMIDLHTFGAMRKKFTQLPDGKVLGNGRMFKNPHLLLDNQTQKLFMPDMERGYFRYIDDKTGEFEGENYTPGFRVGVGFSHFKRIFTDSNIREPFVKIFIWTVIFALGTVGITLAIGMVLACFAQWEFLKGRAIYRVILILPYAVPSFISILVFKGLFNENFGEINRIIDFVFGVKPEWTTSPNLARMMLLIVNAWLGYPYMMILCMGLLKSIPDDLYEASAMDGAGPIQNFFNITVPLLWKPLFPLMIASFAFNFNNFVLIMLLTNGGPDYLPEPGSTTATMAGATDLLVSYTYRLAFEGGAGGHDYGLASAIATMIFILVGALAVAQLKLTKRDTGR